MFRTFGFLAFAIVTKFLFMLDKPIRSGFAWVFFLSFVFNILLNK